VNCPFCTEKLDPEAIVCKACSRDVTVPRPVLEANRRLEQKVEELKEEISELKLRLERSQPTDAVILIQDVCAFFSVHVLLPIATLVAVYAILVTWLDVNLLWLRFATALVPVGFGCLLAVRRRPRALSVVAVALVVSLGAILGMSIVEFFQDGEPVFPEKWSVWQENIGFAAMIALGLILGAIIGAAIRSAHHVGASKHKGFAGVVATFLAHALPHKKGGNLEKRIDKWHGIVRVVMSIIAAIGMIYSGFNKFHYYEPHSAPSTEPRK
jgi:hypothetical protein